MLHPEVFQGEGRSSPYFEGWYFKNISSDGETILALIPGISHSGKESHSFIQVIDGRTLETEYYTFPAEAFLADKKKLDISIGSNRFHSGGFSVDLRGVFISLKGDITFSRQTLFPSHFYSPGIMGWYSFVPFMECNHGVVSIDHLLSGDLSYNGRSRSFTGGRGYIEKDWGKSFPSAWIWMQSNHFASEGDSFMFSAAAVPWIGRSFNGFTAFLRVSGKIYRFATYTGAKIISIEKHSDFIKTIVDDHGKTLSVTAHRSGIGELRAPVNGAMDRRIPESVSAEIEILFRDRDGSVIFEGKGLYAGLESVGDLQSESQLD